MDRPTSGTVLLEGRDLTSLTDAEMSRVRLTRMGYVVQQAYVLGNLNVRDNVLLPALTAAPRQKAAAVARVDGLLERFGIAHVAGHRITQVSGGQLQRAAICRALACEPSVLFADEPTGALNSQHDGRRHGRAHRRAPRGDDARHGDPRPGLRGPRRARRLPPGRPARGLARARGLDRGAVGAARGRAARLAAEAGILSGVRPTG
ncbi:ATP-binding cassette domain-containing protein [Isoptericola variabilis]|uniref:ATP-binding cassette domain-containing protein n=1 Tax=Isoptericola variabilis TaxID=139208 RepID=UPI003704BF70